jgi:hypothetical protein
MDSIDFVELTNEQRRQLIDAQQVFASWGPAAHELSTMGTVTTLTSKGQQYVYENHGTVRKSLGRATPELLRKKEHHAVRRKALQTRVKALWKRIDNMAPVNRALRLGTMRRIAARILRELDREGLLGSHVIVAGTNALHAYEVAAGVTISQHHVATTDADLVWDTTQSLLLAATGIRREGLMGILRRVDRSFVADYGFNATNNDGFVVDLLCPETDGFVTMNRKSDLEATPMAGIDWLLAAPRFEQFIVADDGYPLRLVVPEPRTYALHKLWVSRRSDRSAVKRPRDVGHAALVAELSQTYLGKRFVAKDMPWLSKDLKALNREINELKRQK